MKYFVLLAGYGEMPAWDELTADEQEAAMARHVAFDEACAGRPGVEVLSEASLGDGSVATTLRTAAVRRRSPTARSPRRRSRSAATTCSTRPTSTP